MFADLLLKTPASNPYEAEELIPNWYDDDYAAVESFIDPVEARLQMLGKFTQEPHLNHPRAAYKQHLFTTAYESLLDQAEPLEFYNVAVEGMVDSIQTHLAEWISKAAKTMAATGKIILDSVVKLTSGILSLGSKTVNLAWDGAKNASKIVKAHPYASTALALTTILGIGLVVTAIMGSMPAALTYESVAASAAKINQVVRGIKWPFGTFSVAQKSSGALQLVVTKSSETALVEAPLAQSGWTKNLFQGLLGQVTKIRSIAPAISTYAKKMYDQEVKFVQTTLANNGKIKAAAKIGFKSGAKYLSILHISWSVIKLIVDLIKEIVITGLHVVSTTFKAIGRGLMHHDNARMAKQNPQETPVKPNTPNPKKPTQNPATAGV